MIAPLLAAPLSHVPRAHLALLGRYNANINTFCVVRLVFEQLHSGGVKPFADVRAC